MLRWTLVLWVMCAVLALYLHASQDPPEGGYTTRDPQKRVWWVFFFLQTAQVLFMIRGLPLREVRCEVTVVTLYNTHSI